MISTESLKSSLEDSGEYRTFLNDRPEIMKLIKALEFLQAYNSRMELQQALMALYCFYLDDAERTPSNLGDLMDQFSSTVSRNLAAIGSHGVHGKPGYNWVKLEEDEVQRNRKNIVVTSKGHKVRRMLAHIVGGRV